MSRTGGQARIGFALISLPLEVLTLASLRFLDHITATSELAGFAGILQG
jgi:hypothetical protein